MTAWDSTVDLLVFGAGAGGMTAALTGALDGLDVLLCEKTDQVGGITATSAGTIWVPGTSQSVRAGVPDSIAAAQTYLDSVLGSRSPVLEAFLQAGPQAIDDLEARTEVRFAAATAHPDYLSNRPGAAYGGRALAPLPFDGRRLGADFGRVRPPRPEFLVLGGMMVMRADIAPLLAPFGSMANFRHVARLLARHGMDRLRYRRGTRLVMGNALVARLLFSLHRAGVPIAFDTSLVELVAEDGRITGAVLTTGGTPRRIQARRGVVLATGGFARNPALRAHLLPPAAQPHSLAPETHTGDGMTEALRHGAVLDESVTRAGLWMPCSIRRHPDGTQALFPHIVLDRAKPGLIAVNASGRRFVNEADSYHDFVVAMLETPGSVPAHLICNRDFIHRYGIGFIHPGTRNLAPFLADGYLVEGQTLQDLANRIGVDAAALEATVARHDADARTGIDQEFGRGGSDLNRINGDPAQQPNPCLRPIAPGPFYAVTVWPADLATSAGLRTDVHGQVLGADGPVGGLYACGNDMASIFRGTYPGPGTTIGPAMVFGWLIARHAAGLTS